MTPLATAPAAPTAANWRTRITTTGHRRLEMGSSTSRATIFLVIGLVVACRGSGDRPGDPRAELPGPRDGLQQAPSPAPLEPPDAESVAIPGEDMVAIPAGKFVGLRLMCAPHSTTPIRSLDPPYDEKQSIAAFRIDRRIVACDLYQRCVRAGRCPAEDAACDHGAAVVPRDAAAAYCAWRGARLPTQAEWQRAARGTDGRPFPTGFRWDQEAACSKQQTGTSPNERCLVEGPEGVELWILNRYDEWTGDYDCAIFGPNFDTPPQADLPVAMELGSSRINGNTLFASKNEFRCARPGPPPI